MNILAGVLLVSAVCSALGWWFGGVLNRYLDGGPDAPCEEDAGI